MSDIRKISIGTDYMGKETMHYLLGQPVIGGKYMICDICKVPSTSAVQIYIDKNGERILWKEFSSQLPMFLEYDYNE